MIIQYMIRINENYTWSKTLINWYGTNKRQLPWRESKDPYLIWISEIILQQTRVAQGLDYYHRFTERFPTVKQLAEAGEEDVLKYWQGLGYYSRARNLHEAACDIMTRFSGIFPRQYQEVLSLKGIGEYTAAAIVSFVWDQPYPVIDGNVFRVLSRLFAIDTPIDTGRGKKEFTELAGILLDPSQAGLHNQAIMEFGALQCIPQNPDCLRCPFLDRCAAYNEKKVEYYPVKLHKTKTRDRFFNYFYFLFNGETYLHRRSGKDIWEGLYEFPLIETDQSVGFEELSQTEAFRKLIPDSNLILLSQSTGIKHILSHQIIYTSFYKIEIGSPLNSDSYLKIPLEKVELFAVSKLMHSYLERNAGK